MREEFDYRNASHNIRETSPLSRSSSLFHLFKKISWINFNLKEPFNVSVNLCRQLLQEAKLELRKSKRKDYYKILGIEKNANDEEVGKGALE